MAITAPDVAPQPIPGVRVEPTANDTTFGGGPGLHEQGMEIQKIAQQTGDIATFEKIRADQTAVEEAQAKGSRLATDILYAPQTGVLSSRGTNALQAQKEGMKKLQKGLNDISQTLTGDAQVGSFNKWALSHAEATRTTMMGHVDKELKDHDAKSFDSLLANQQGLVALAHGNPQTLDLGFKTVNENAEAFAARNQLDPDQTKQFIQDANDKMHSSVIDGMLKFQSDDSAQKYFDANKDRISPAAQEKLAIALEEGNVRNQSTFKADAIWNETKGDLTASFAKADKIENLNVREMTRARLREHQTDLREGQEADQSAKYQQAWDLVKKASLGDSPVKLRDVVPPVLWTSLDAGNQDKLKRLAFNNETNAQKWTEFSLMQPATMRAITPQQMQQDWLPEFAPKDRDKAMSLWQKAQGNSQDSYLNSMQSHMIAETARGLGVAGLTAGDPNKPGHDPKKLRGDRAGDYHAWNTTAQQAILNFETTKLGGARKASQEETQQVLDNLVMSKIGQKSFIGMSYGGKTIYETPYSDIPELDRTKIEEFARQRGVKTTPEKVQQAYFYLQQKDKTSAVQVLSK